VPEKREGGGEKRIERGGGTVRLLKKGREGFATGPSIEGRGKRKSAVRKKGLYLSQKKEGRAAPKGVALL